MDLGQRIKKRRQELGLTQAELGRLAGVSQQAIMALEAGTTTRSKRLPELARALGTSVDELLDIQVLSTTYVPAPPPIPTAFRELPRDVPVLGQVAGGAEGSGDFRFNGQVSDYIRRPPGISAARDVFGLYVTGTSMWPRFEEGEPIFVSSSRPPAIGDYVVIELADSEDGEPGPGFIKRLVKRTPTRYVVEQFNPAKEIEFDRAEVKQMLRVIPLAELVGV